MTKKILLIEDDPFLSSLLGNRLKKEGFELVGIKSGSEANKLLKASNPDLVLLDIILPGKSGFEVLEEIKSDPQVAKIPVMIISNLGQALDIEKGRELGVVEYIVKAQVSIDDLVKKIKEYLK
ncbi:MAG: response regulator [Candidatus Harrisonbacteria bacterium]|nr:response regulator [Candidatus Harrisonbacteria bacterium]